MPDISNLLAQLEIAVNAVEPRVLADYNAGLSDAEIDAIMAKEPFGLPADLRALYRWHNGGEQQWHGFVFPYCWMLPIALAAQTPDADSPPFTLQNSSHHLREEIRMFYEICCEAPPLDLDAMNFFSLFDYGGDGTVIVAVWPHEEKALCQVWMFDPADYPVFYPIFDNIELMITTALAWWQSGVFTPHESEFGWDLDVNWEKRDKLGKQFNLNCSYWSDKDETA